MLRAVFTYPLRLPLRAAHYDAIGRVIAFWAFVEREIKGEIAWLDQRVNERKTIDFEKSFGALATKWGELAAKAALPRKAIIAINRIAGQSAKTKLRRDNLAHGTFLGSAEGPIYLKTKGGGRFRRDALPRVGDRQYRGRFTASSGRPWPAF